MFRNVNGLTGGREAESDRNSVSFCKKADYSTSRYSFKNHSPVFVPGEPYNSVQAGFTCCCAYLLLTCSYTRLQLLKPKGI